MGTFTNNDKLGFRVSKLLKLLSYSLFFYGLICLALLGFKGLHKLAKQLDTPLNVEKLCGLSPRQIYPEKRFIWTDAKTRTAYQYRIHGVLPTDFDAEAYLADHPEDAVELSTRHENLEVFTNSIDKNYFPKINTAD